MDEKILVLGDIHGRSIWMDIINKEDPTKVIFLGDYVSSHDGISSKDQIRNMNDILLYKESDPENVMLLRGNHDIQYLCYKWAQNWSGFNPEVAEFMYSIKDHFLELTQWLHHEYISIFIPHVLFSHAGVSKTWLSAAGKTPEDYKWIHDINKLDPSEELFGFRPESMWDMDGTSITQSPIWIRPRQLVADALENYTQIVGHTQLNSGLTNYKDKIYFCDALGQENPQYLIIENQVIKICDLYDEVNKEETNVQNKN